MYVFQQAASRGVATGWTWVNMSPPLCPEGVPEIDADSPSLDSGCVKEIIHCPTPNWEGTPFPHSTDIVHPTLLDLATSVAASLT